MKQAQIQPCEARTRQEASLRQQLLDLLERLEALADGLFVSLLRARKARAVDSVVDLRVDGLGVKLIERNLVLGREEIDLRAGRGMRSSRVSEMGKRGTGCRSAPRRADLPRDVWPVHRKRC